MPPRASFTRPSRPALRRGSPTLTRANADRHVLYQHAVQEPSSEVAFCDATFKKLRGRRAAIMREDFCGTAASACAWVGLRETNTAVGLDLHGPTLAWGRRHNVGALPTAARGRIRLLERDVRDPGPEGIGADFVSAMNFSYFIFRTREAMRAYFESVRASLVKDGVMFLDVFGGYESMKEQEERRSIRVPGRGRFTYVWEQKSYDPITGEMACRIHFEFAKGPAWRDAFKYDWRLWTIPEIRELLAEAGFARSTVYLEGDDGKGGGDGIFRPRVRGPADACFIGYIVAEK